MPEKIPGTDDIVIKPGFEERYRCLCDDYDEFMKYSLSFMRRSIRVNTLKITVNEVKRRLEEKNWILTPIPWCKEGFWLDHKEGRRDIGNTEEHVLGYIYVQESASMLPPIALNPKPGEIILDMASAPGSKSSQIGQMMNNTGLVVCNDYKGMRVRPLGLNLQRVGTTNTIISLMEGQRIKGMQFDRILVDAPCSGTGTIRKSLKTLRMWNPNMIKRLSITQKQMIENAFNLLKPGGTMVYSTCTLEPGEDEAVVSFLLNKYDNASTVPIKIDIKKRDPILEFEGEKYHQGVKNALRIWPQDNDSEGFFVAKIQKA